ncbi:MAG: hypothetical protein FJ276_20525 [Planctomycetes bacterium]|nr:hypothetical protein [Planctomycetota bacterium]
MSSVKTRPGAPHRTDPSPGLRVVNWPLRDDVPHAAGVMACCLATGVLTGALSASWSMGVVSAAAMTLSFWKLWVPISCEMAERGVTISVWRRRRFIAWHDIDHLEWTGRGVFFCADADRSPLSALRQLYLPWPGDREAAVHWAARHRPRVDAPGSTATWNGNELDSARVR